MNAQEMLQLKHERNAAKCQQKIETLLKKHKLALVSQYVQALNEVHLELIPVELADARNAHIQQLKEEKVAEATAPEQIGAPVLPEPTQNG